MSAAKEPPSGPGWAHELKHDGYRLQIHIADGRVRLFTMNGNDWTKRYPRIVEEAARIKGSAVMDAEVVCLIKRGTADFDMLHSRNNDHLARIGYRHANGSEGCLGPTCAHEMDGVVYPRHLASRDRTHRLPNLKTYRAPTCVWRIKPTAMPVLNWFTSRPRLSLQTS